MDILETSFKIHFSPRCQEEAIFGMIYGILKDDFGTCEKTPFCQIPSEIRAKDPNLRNQPLFILKSKNNEMLAIGTNILVYSQIGNKEEYDEFQKKSSDIIKKIDKLNIWNQILIAELKQVRSGKRENLLNEIEFSVRVGKQQINPEDYYYQLTWQNMNFTVALAIMNSAKKVVEGNLSEEKIAVVDVSIRQEYDEDSFSVDEISSFQKELLSLLENIQK